MVSPDRPAEIAVEIGRIVKSEFGSFRVYASKSAAFPNIVATGEVREYRKIRHLPTKV